MHTCAISFSQYANMYSMASPSAAMLQHSLPLPCMLLNQHRLLHWSLQLNQESANPIT